MRKSIIFVIILTLVAKIFGFGRDITLSYFYGTSYISDAYLVTITICISIFGIIGKAVTSTFIPLYKGKEINDNKYQENLFMNNVINLMALLIIIITTVSIIFTEQIVKIFASGFEGETLNLAITFTQVAIVGMSLIVLINIFNGFLQIKGNHRLPALISLPLNIVVIITIIISSTYSIYFLPYGLLIGTIIQFLIVFFRSYKYGYRFKIYLNLQDYSIKKLVKNSQSVLIGTSTQQINLIIDRTLASQIVEGGISALSYANRLNGFVQSIFVLSVTAVMYPILSKEALENDEKKFNNTLIYSLSSMAIMIIPVSFFILIFAEEIITLLYGRGDFDQQSIYLTAGPLFYYSLGMIAFAYREVLNRAFYAYDNTRTPMINAILGVSLNVVLNFLLSHFMGINGLALATSISAIFTTILLFISYKKRNTLFNFKHLLNIFSKTVMSSIVMVIGSSYFYNLMNQLMNQWVSMFFTIIIGVIIYSILLILFKVNEFKELIKMISHKFF